MRVRVRVQVRAKMACLSSSVVGGEIASVDS